MKHSDFRIGVEFRAGGGRFRCTDIGTRVIVAIKMDDAKDNPSWLNGPPYALVEMVFDEDDIKGCWLEE